MQNTLNRNLLLLLLIVSFSLTSCTPKSNTKEIIRETTTVNNSNGTGAGNGTGNGNSGVPGTFNSSCYAAGTGNQGNDYYTLPNIVAHGAGSNVVTWSSATDPRLQNPSDQNIFVTDSRFNVRVLAYPSPGQGLDTYNRNCQYIELPYTKLQVKVGIKTQSGNTYVAQYVFDNISANSCSNVKEFTLPQSNSPFIVEVLNVRWDYSCKWYTQQGFPDVPQCPWDYVWPNDCYEIALQIATDYTKDIPH